MYSQSFTARELYECTTQSERCNLGLGREGIIKKIDDILCMQGGIDGLSFAFKSEHDFFTNGQVRDTDMYFIQELVLRKIYKNIKHIYGIQQANRNTIIRILYSLLQERTPHWVVRLDVKHFYASINRDSLVRRLELDGRLTRTTMGLLKKLLVSSNLGSGLPRGLAISAAMSELYMKYFDYAMKRIEGVYFYARFVDDVVVLCVSEEVQKVVNKEISEQLKKYGLDINTDKTKLWNSDGNGSKVPLEYLGYSFNEIQVQRGGKTHFQMEASISIRKINKIKTRLTKAFLDYAKRKDFELLKMRIKFLTGNISIPSDTSLLPIKVGIYYNYRYATLDGVTGDLKMLDKYYQKLLHCRQGKLGRELCLTKEQTQELERYSFLFGFKYRVLYHFSKHKIGMIKQCWR
ncbi:antiviral reverse transcriptase Drt3a [Porphyromonas catoniae]|uniref:antiviral reverse transcriptase Drt3a n=1 Tax=Porphyromonas catoniae TaxID=41976 RepID=UPI0023F513CC|nr:antiviral reverse transcriptase Drt3a [Porphyromonas catoniae]